MPCWAVTKARVKGTAPLTFMADPEPCLNPKARWCHGTEQGSAHPRHQLHQPGLDSRSSRGRALEERHGGGSSGWGHSPSPPLQPAGCSLLTHLRSLAPAGTGQSLLRHHLKPAEAAFSCLQAGGCSHPAETKCPVLYGASLLLTLPITQALSSGPSLTMSPILSLQTPWHPATCT